MSGSDWCWNHDPKTEHVRRSARAKGGRRGKRGRPSAAAGTLEIDSIEQAVLLLSLAANETLRLDNSVSRNRVLADIAHKAISASQVGELEERISALEGAAYSDSAKHGIASRSPGEEAHSRLRVRQGSVHARVERLEAARLSEYASFGTTVSDVVIAVLERHIRDPALQRAIRNDLATDVLSLTQKRSAEAALRD